MGNSDHGTTHTRALPAPNVDGSVRHTQRVNLRSVSNSSEEELDLGSGGCRYGVKGLWFMV